MCECLFMSVHHVCAWSSQRPEKGDCEPHGKGPGNPSYRSQVFLIPEPLLSTRMPTQYCHCSSLERPPVPKKGTLCTFTGSFVAVNTYELFPKEHYTSTLQSLAHDNCALWVPGLKRFSCFVASQQLPTLLHIIIWSVGRKAPILRGLS